MNICLIETPVWVDFLPSYELPYLSANLTKEGHRVYQIDLNIEILYDYQYDQELLKEHIKELFKETFSNSGFEENPLQKIIVKKVDEIISTDPELVSFMVNSETLLAALLIAKEIKKRKNVIIVLIRQVSYIRPMRDLGFAITAPQILKSFEFVDVFGKNEDVLPSVIKKWTDYKKTESLSDIPGVAIKNGKRVIINEKPLPTPDLNSGPPLFDGLPLDKYLLPILPVISSKGCKMNCAFCSTKYLRYGVGRCVEKNLENVISEIEHLKEKYRYNYFFFCDDLMNNNLERLERLCDLMEQNGLNIYWGGKARVMPPNNKTKNILEKMQKNGCRFIFYGIESGSQRVLDKMKKGVKVDWISKTLEWSKEAGIYSMTSWIVNLPGETLKDFQKTLEFIEKNRQNIDATFIGRFALLEGSDIFQNPQKYDIKKEKPLCSVLDIYSQEYDYNNSENKENRFKEWLFKNKAYDLGIDFDKTVSLYKLFEKSITPKKSRILKERCENISLIYNRLYRNNVAKPRRLVPNQ